MAYDLKPLLTFFISFIPWSILGYYVAVPVVDLLLAKQIKIRWF